jgi:hypothetical protein
MSSVNNIQINENGKNNLLSIINKKVSIENANTSQKDDEKPQNIENGKTKSCKLIYIILIVVGLLIIVAASISIPIILKKKKKTIKRMKIMKKKKKK